MNNSYDPYIGQEFIKNGKKIYICEFCGKGHECDQFLRAHRIIYHKRELQQFLEKSEYSNE